MDNLTNNTAIVLFDGVCNLCNNSVQFIIKHDKKNIFKFASLQSAIGQQLLKTYELPTSNFSSFVLIQHNKTYTQSTAALKITQQLNGPIKLLYAFMIVPAFIRNKVYDVIAKNRYKWFGKREVCMLPSPQLASKFLS
ncbi:thiol-disulfide oxidoreductase DCC family protein [Ferruginibacter yonginensis]|uniref:Thiol-disulfide oxidoreductase DCC family protein n=1 Tax=Ferruginibacter yonginensis TaxID=1310416 RepID=A0ABV8QU38_9BACT